MTQTQLRLSAAETVLLSKDLQVRVNCARLLADERALRTAIKTVSTVVDDRRWYANTDADTVNERAELFARSLIVLVTRFSTPQRVATLRTGMMSEETLELDEALKVISHSLNRIKLVNGTGRLVYIEDVYAPDIEINPEIEEGEDSYSRQLLEVFKQEWPKLEAAAVRRFGVALSSVIDVIIEDAEATATVWKQFRTATIAYLFALEPPQDALSA